MLKALRNKKIAKKIWIILAIIVVPAFVLWGLGGAIRSRQESAYAGKIFGRNISILEYKDAVNAVRNSAIMQYGDKLSEAEKYLNLNSQAWERLILLYEAKKRKIHAGDKEVIDLIESYPFFQRNGQFDNRIYSETLHYVFRTQPRIFEEQTRQNILIAKLYNQVTYKIRINDEEIKQEYRKLNEEISLYYIAAIPADFAKSISPTEQEIKDYYDKNSLEFKQPLSFNMDYLTADSEEKAKDVISRLNKREDFSKIAKEMGLTIKETGLFSQTDPIPGIGWSQEVSNMISNLRVGQFTHPIHADKNYFILKMKERKEAFIPELEKIKDKVKEVAIKERSSKLAKEKIDGCLKDLKELFKQNPKSADFEAYAKKIGLKYDHTKPFKFGSYIEGIGASDNFWTIGTGLKDGEFSDYINMPSGFFIIKVKERIPVDQKKFEKEKAEFTGKLLSQKKQEYFAKFTEELIKKAQL